MNFWCFLVTPAYQGLSHSLHKTCSLPDVNVSHTLWHQPRPCVGAGECGVSLTCSQMFSKGAFLLLCHIGIGHFLLRFWFGLLRVGCRPTHFWLLGWDQRSRCGSCSQQQITWEIKENARMFCGWGKFHLPAGLQTRSLLSRSRPLPGNLGTTLHKNYSDITWKKLSFGLLTNECVQWNHLS